MDRQTNVTIAIRNSAVATNVRPLNTRPVLLVTASNSDGQVGLASLSVH